MEFALIRSQATTISLLGTDSRESLTGSACFGVAQGTLQDPSGTNATVLSGGRATRHILQPNEARCDTALFVADVAQKAITEILICNASTIAVYITITAFFSGHIGGSLLSFHTRLQAPV
jgi:hypothetical protein